MTKSSIPGPRGYPIVGVLPQALREPLGCFRNAVRDYGDVVRLPLIGEAIVVVNHPSLVREVLQLRYRDFTRSRFHDRMKPVVGEGLVTSDGAQWAQHRALMQPYFGRRRIDRLAPVLVEVAEARIAKLVDARNPTAVVDLEQAMIDLTIELFCRAMFGNRLSAESIHTVGKLMSALTREYSAALWLHRLGRTLLLRPDLVGQLDAIVEAELSGARHGDDLLAALATELPPKLLRDEIVTLLFAGHETTAMALTWAAYLLAKHPEVQALLAEEVASREPADLTYTTRVIWEALRLYPPIWRMTRRAAGDQPLGGHVIPADATLIVCQYTTHRDARWWTSPERFDPDRFAKKVDNFSYFPFSRGPRTCIGIHLAMLEMQVVLATILRHYRIEPSDTPVEPKAFFSLRTKNGAWLRLTRRD